MLMPQPINPTEEMEHMAALSRSHDPTFHFLNPLDITVRKELYSFLLISAIKQNNFEFNGRFAFSRFFFGALCICIVYIYVFASLFEFLICYAHVLWVFGFFLFYFWVTFMLFRGSAQSNAYREIFDIQLMRDSLVYQYMYKLRTELGK